LYQVFFVFKILCQFDHFFLIFVIQYLLLIITNALKKT